MKKINIIGIEIISFIFMIILIFLTTITKNYFESIIILLLYINKYLFFIYMELIK